MEVNNCIYIARCTSAELTSLLGARAAGLANLNGLPTQCWLSRTHWETLARLSAYRDLQRLQYNCLPHGVVQKKIPSPYLPTRMYAFRPFGNHVNGDPTQRRKCISRHCPDLPATTLVANWDVGLANVLQASGMHPDIAGVSTSEFFPAKAT